MLKWYHAKNETQLQLVLRQCSYCQLFAGSSNRELVRTEDQPGGSAFRFIDLLRVLPASTGQPIINLQSGQSVHKGQKF